MHGNQIDLTGQRFGSLIALEPADLKLKNSRSSVWKCQCDCGNICYKTSSDLHDTRRVTLSCGCKNRGNRRFPNKYVQRTHLTRTQSARAEFAAMLIRRVADAPYRDELKTIINDMLNELNGVTV